MDESRDRRLEPDITLVRSEVLRRRQYSLIWTIDMSVSVDLSHTEGGLASCTEFFRRIEALIEDMMTVFAWWRALVSYSWLCPGGSFHIPVQIYPSYLGGVLRRGRRFDSSVDRDT